MSIEEVWKNVDVEKFKFVKLFFIVIKDGVIKNVCFDRLFGYFEVDEKMKEFIK